MIASAVERPPEPILLVGYTMRMLAELATRAGYDVIALDYFGDSDLRAMAPSVSLLRDFAGAAYDPAALVDAACTLAAPSVAYSASFENHPGLVAALANGRTLLGNDPETLVNVRDPFQLAAALAQEHFLFPRTQRHRPDESDRMGMRWLWKPLRSGGGHGVRELGRDFIREPNPDSSTEPEHEVPSGVWQEKLEGLVCSAAFVANGQQAVILGLTEQLVGLNMFGATGYRHCGNIVPPRVSVAAWAEMLREAHAIANHLTQHFGLRGVNGIDFIWREGRIWTLEVNPRPSASLELIDRAYDVRVFDMHVKACAGVLPTFSLADAQQHGATTVAAMGKAIVFALDEDVMCGDTSGWFAHDIRDVPHPNEHISRRHPICTVLAHGANADEVLDKLQARAADIRMQLTATS